MPATKSKKSSKAASLENKKAPAIKLPDENGDIRSLGDYLGQYVLLYFYPRDMTPGCTVEAELFRDKKRQLTSLDVQVIGISCDNVASHKKFKDKYKLNFPLLADEDKKIVEKYGVWVEKSMYGKKYMGIQRDSFLIDPKGKIIKYYEKVKPKEHAQQVIDDVKELG